jgi:signal transduction histidine kinase
MSESLTQHDDLVEAAGREMSEMKRALNLALSKQAVEERQRQAEQRTVVSLLTAWLTKTSGLAQEMGTPLNVILGRAESLLDQTEDDRTQAALQSIVRQVEQLIPLRRQLCALDHGFNSKLPAPDRETMKEGPRAGC